MTDWNPWVCTHCKSVLPGSSAWKDKTIVCAACGAIYPRIGQEAAIFVKDPKKHLVDTCLIMEQQVRSYQARSAAAAQQLSNNSPRSGVYKHLIDAWACNVELVRAIQDKLISAFPPEKQASLKNRIALTERH